MDEKMTAVEWLIKNIPQRFANALANECRDEIEQAKRMEKQQIKDAINYALDEDGHTGDWRITFINSYLEKISDAKDEK